MATFRPDRDPFAPHRHPGRGGGHRDPRNGPDRAHSLERAQCVRRARSLRDDAPRSWL